MPRKRLPIRIVPLAALLLASVALAAPPAATQPATQPHPRDSQPYTNGALTGLNELGRQCQEKLMKLPARLARLADYADAKTVKRGFAFDFLYARGIEI